MADTVEREIKLVVPHAYELPDPGLLCDGLAFVPLSAQDLDATYHDTSNQALLAQGATLRRRTGEGPTRWTLKLPMASSVTGVLARRELEVLDEGATAPAELAEAVTAALGPAVLGEVARLVTHRRRWALTMDGETVGELADDAVTGCCPTHAPVQFREIELELDADLPAELVAALREALRAAGATDETPLPKLDRVLRLVAESSGGAR